MDILNRETLTRILEPYVYQRFSAETEKIQWTEELIDKYADIIDWKELSENESVEWSTSMLEKYKDKLNWDSLSQRHNGLQFGRGVYGETGKFRTKENQYNLFSTENLRKFSNYWNWSLLSENSHVEWTAEQIEEFKDLIDWTEWINHFEPFEEFYTLDFYFKYQDYIPLSKLFQSRFWDTIVYNRMENQINEGL